MVFIPPTPIYPMAVQLPGYGGLAGVDGLDGLDGAPGPASTVPGPAGPPGPSGSAVPVDGTAGEALSGHRAVAFTATGQVFLASADGANASAAAGITMGAAALGAVVSVTLSGPVTEPSWAWVQGPVWLGASGLLTQVPPTSGTLVRMGTALSATSINVAPQVVAKLS